MARRLCEELDELRDRTDYLERILDKYNMYRMDGRASFRGATWELSETHIAQWTAASSLPLGPTDDYARFVDGGLEIRGGMFDIHSGEGTERVEIDGTGIRGYAAGVAVFTLDAATGLITATGGTIGGWTLSATAFTGGNATLHSTGYLNLGAANDIVKLSAVDATYRMWVGHAAAGSAPFRVTKAGVLYATGAILSGTMQSSNYVSNVSGWQIDVGGRAEFQNVVIRGELHAAIFVKDLIEARAGTMIIAKSAGALSDDVAVPAAGTWLIYVNDPPSGAAFLFANADECQIAAEHATGVRSVWFTVSARADMGDGRQRYTCTYTAGTRNVTYYAGSIIIDYGVANQGLLRMTAEPVFNGPYFEILTTAGAPWTPDFVVQSRWGNLNGSYGYGATTFGIGLGSYGVANSITVDTTNGIRFFDATPTVLAQLTGGVWTIGDTASEHVLINATAIQFKDGATVHTDISGGNVTVGAVGANLSNIIITAGALALRGNITNRITMTAAGILSVNDSGGNPVITLDAALGAEITKKLTMPGANSAISIGAVPPTASNAGTGIWIDRIGMYGLAANVLQAKFDAVTGAITAGAGAVTLDADGVGILAQETAGAITLGGIPQLNSTTWIDSGDNVLFRIGVSKKTTAVTDSQIHLYAPTTVTTNSSLYLGLHQAILYGPHMIFKNVGGTESVEIWGDFNAVGAITLKGEVIATRGLNVGTATGAGTGGIEASGTLIALNTAAGNVFGAPAGYGVVAAHGNAADKAGVLELVATDLTAANIAGEVVFGNLDGGAGVVSQARVRAQRDGADDALSLSFWTEATAAGVSAKMTIAGDGGVFMPNLKSGANQGAAGAAANELWVDTADQTIKLGV